MTAVPLHFIPDGFNMTADAWFACEAPERKIDASCVIDSRCYPCWLAGLAATFSGDWTPDDAFVVLCDGRAFHEPFAQFLYRSADLHADRIPTAQLERLRDAAQG